NDLEPAGVRERGHHGRGHGFGDRRLLREIAEHRDGDRLHVRRQVSTERVAATARERRDKDESSEPREKRPTSVMRRVQLQRGARRQHARRTPCTLSVLPRAPTQQMGPYHHARVTMLTRRPGTTTTLATSRPFSHGSTRPSASAIRRISASSRSTSAMSRLLTFPSTWTTIWTSSRFIASWSGEGHDCLKRLAPCPRVFHNSSVM